MSVVPALPIVRRAGAYVDANRPLGRQHLVSIQTQSVADNAPLAKETIKEFLFILKQRGLARADESLDHPDRQ